MEIKNLSRRDFLTLAGVAGAGLGLAACAQAPAPTPTAMSGMGGEATPAGTGPEEYDERSPR